jgi:CheY-like chemotaxis protein
MGVVSAHGKGSTFWFTIEVRSTTISPTLSENNENEIKLTDFFKGYSPKILLVDDNQVNRKVASEILLKSGCKVITADSGAKAIAIFGEKHGFDVIFMDIQMPEMDGIETTKKMRQLYGNLLPKVVAMTAYSMQHDRERFLSEGMDDYVPKPIRASILIQKVNELVPNSKAKVEVLEVVTSNKTIRETVISNSPINPEFQVFDMEIVNQLKEMVGEEMLISVFEDFEREAEEQIQNAKNAYPNDVKIIQQELHTLKGNSGTIGLTRIHDITEILEIPSKTGDLTHFQSNLVFLEEEFKIFREKYKTLL